MCFSFITVYINIRQNWQCLRGYSPGWQFWRHYLCFCILKCNKLCLFDLVLVEGTLYVTVSAQKRRARVPNYLKRHENNMFLWWCNSDQLRNWQFCQSLVSQRAAALDAPMWRRSKREDSVLNHSRCFQWLIWSDGLCKCIYSSNLYTLYWINVLQ